MINITTNINVWFALYLIKKRRPKIPINSVKCKKTNILSILGKVNLNIFQLENHYQKLYYLRLYGIVGPKVKRNGTIKEND